MKIEAGKYYRTRDGRRAYVDSVRLPNPLAPKARYKPVSGFLEGNDGSSTRWWSDGRWGPADSSPKGIDLISEWDAPDKTSAWVVVFWNEKHGYDGDVAFTASDAGEMMADPAEGWECIARKRIEITEGEFDE